MAEQAEPESSTGEIDQDVAAQATEQQAESSDATQDVAHESMLAAVTAAAEPQKAEESSASEAEVKGEAEAKAEEKPDATAEPDDELKWLDQLKDQNVPLGKIERFKRVLEENRTLKQWRSSVEPAVNRVQEIANAARVAGLGPEEVSAYFEALEIARTDPKGAYERIQPVVSKFALAAGQQLPPDLAKRVEDGFLDKESAAELATARAVAQRAQENAAIEREEREAKAARDRQESIRTAVDRVEIELRSSDPDFPAKMKMVRAELIDRAQREQRRPDTPEEAVQWTREAYRAATEALRGMLPKPEPRRDPPARRFNAPSKPMPNSMLEAVQAGLEAAQQ